MRVVFGRWLIGAGLLLRIVSDLAAADRSRDAAWPQFRGPNASGVGATATPPLKISPTNLVRWERTVPWSPSSPAIAGNRIFISTFAEGELQTRCYDRQTGKELWTRGVKPGKIETFHRSEGSPAASTPATDGQRVLSYFGSIGLLCYDLDGKEVWRYPMPVAQSGGFFGSGTSPIIAGSAAVLLRDQEEGSFLLALNLNDGKELWKTARPEVRG